MRGRAVEGPAWFKRAIACAPARDMLDRDGGKIEMLSWGETGRPGLLFMHGNIATADIWRIIAPFFRETHRAVAFSWPGLGRSAWRPRYSTSELAADAVAVAHASGLLDGPSKPVFVAHSAGAGPALAAAHQLGPALGGLILADGRVRPPAPGQPFPTRPHRIYATLENALAHFRFAPAQPCTNLFIADLIARAAIMKVDGGWTWRFDPRLYRNFPNGDAWDLLPGVACPLALIDAEHSTVTGGEDRAARLERLPAGSVRVVIPETHHHLMVDQPIAFVSVLRSIMDQWKADFSGVESPRYTERR
ncbi:hypothetical protein WP12_18565 [Sphingomonas sp. SRS2]|nr:hypothetical protein WP12_18565 [Sphingomonas sp. SRS2]